tara:strand:+ start:7160 stop:7426 length:267 start_codon:yes stop_codon:yes gene_type:complete
MYLNGLERNFALLCTALMAVSWYFLGSGHSLVFGLMSLSLVRAVSIVARYDFKVLLDLSPYRIRLTVYAPIFVAVSWVTYTFLGNSYA